MIEHWPAPNKNEAQDRINRVANILLDLGLTNGSTILDVGGSEYKSFCEKNQWKYTTANLNQAMNGVLYNVLPDTVLYDGLNLPFESNSFEVVVVNFVLHHAEDAIGLLQQIANITKKYIIVGEDLCDVTYPKKWILRNHEHQMGGNFRSDREWRHIFKLLDLTIQKQCVIHRKDDLDASKVFRTVYVLTRSNT